MEAPGTLRVGNFELSWPEVERLRSEWSSDPAPASAVKENAANGWLEVNRHYLQEQRELAGRSMRAMMGVLTVDSVETPEEALDLVDLALRVFSPPEGYQGHTVRKGSNQLLMVNPYCPIFNALEEHKWRGVTACPSWYIRRGWLDALGVEATDLLVTEKKWGYRTCTASISVESPVAAGAR